MFLSFKTEQPQTINRKVEQVSAARSSADLIGELPDEARRRLQSLFELMKINLTVPDHSTLSRRRRSLNVTLPVRDWSKPRHLVVDSTGAKVYGEGEWKVRQHGISKHGAKATIPPRKGARIWQHNNRKTERHIRDENLRRIRKMGRKQWKIGSDYHRRSLAETTMFRFETGCKRAGYRINSKNCYSRPRF